MFSVNDKTTVAKLSGRHKSFRRTLVICAGAALAIATAGSAIAQSMVVRSTGPSASEYPRGKKLAANARVTLRASDAVTVLDKNGTRVLKGPGTFTLDGAVSRDQNASTQIASLLTTDGRARRARTGAVRSAACDPAVQVCASDDKRSPNLWYVDISRAGKFCVANPSQILLWRPQIGEDQVVELGGEAGGSATLAFKANSTVVLWPVDAVPVAANGMYNLVNSDDSVVRVQLVPVTVDPANAEQVAEILISNGCENQLDLMVDKLVSSAAIQESVGG